MSDSSKIVVIPIVCQFEMGGMEKPLVEIACRADKDRFELDLGAIGQGRVIAEVSGTLGWSVRSREQGDGLHPGLTVRLALLFRHLEADVVHTHNAQSLMYAGPAVCLAEVKRVFHTRHGQSYGSSRRESALFCLTPLAVCRFVCVSRDSATITRGGGVSLFI